MHKEEIREKLEGLREELEETQEEYADVTSEIEDLSWDLSNLENEQYRLEKKESDLFKEIQELEEQLMDKEFEELDNALTGDKFRDAFIKCSWFCRKYEDTSVPLTHVKITGKRLVATDGCIGIVIECDSIPEELKNTFIRWDVRENFKDNAEKKPMSNFSFIDDAIKEGKGYLTLQTNLEEFKEKLWHKTKTLYEEEIVILSFNSEKVAFKKKYLDIALKTFDTDIVVYWPKTKYSPLIIENEGQKAILLPIRLNDNDY